MQKVKKLSLVTLEEPLYWLLEYQPEKCTWQHFVDGTDIDVDVDADVDGGDGESLHWLLEYWSWSWRSARSCFDPGTACSRFDLGGWRERARIHPPTAATS